MFSWDVFCESEKVWGGGLVCKVWVILLSVLLLLYYDYVGYKFYEKK